MVVQYLESYVQKKVPGACYSANLGKLIEKEKLNGKVPTIVLDESASFRLLYNLQPKIYRTNMVDFVRKVISCGAKLVVFIRGNIVEDVDYWYRKQLEKFMVKKRAFEAFSGGKTNNDITEEIEQDLLKFCKLTTLNFIQDNHYKVITSIKDVHVEAAEFAAKNNCLAVIGQDSNYFIYEGIRFYIFTKSLDAKTLDCTIFDRQKLIKHLGLQPYHLPLFATLCSNDVVPPMYVKQFQIEISSTHSDKFLSIAKIVKGTTKDPYRHAKIVADLINHPKVDKNLIIKSLDMYLKYSSDVTENKEHEFANERKKLGEWSTTLYRVFTLRQFRNSFLTELNPCNLSIMEILKPLRKKIYGILFFDSGIPSVDEYFLQEMLKGKQTDKPIPVTCIGEKPKSKHPGLIQLWDKNTPNLSCLKWDLFCTSISRTLTQSILKEIPPEFLYPVLSLHYLVTEVPHFLGSLFNENFEIETFLVVALLVSSDDYDPYEVQKLELTTKSDLRLTYLSFCFVETCFMLNMLNEACGLVVPKDLCCICNYYDGILVRYVYEKMKKGAEWKEFFDGKAILEITFSTLLEMIHERGTNV